MLLPCFDSLDTVAQFSGDDGGGGSAEEVRGTDGSQEQGNQGEGSVVLSAPRARLAGRYKAVKLRCSLCDAVFSASNPSRTTTEHLKRGTCLKFTSSQPSPTHSLPPRRSRSHPSLLALLLPPRPRLITAASAQPHLPLLLPATFPCSPSPILLAPPPRTACTSNDVAHFATPLPPPQRLQSCTLTMLDDSVKKKKSPKSSPVPVHSKSLVDFSLSLLINWLYEALGAGGISLSSLEHLKFLFSVHRYLHLIYKRIIFYSC